MNLGNGSPVGLLTSVELLEQELGVTAKRVMAPMQPGDEYETYVDTAKAEALLGFRTTINLEVGIQSFVAWYRQYYKV